VCSQAWIKVDGAVTETFIGGGCKPVMSGSIDLQ
jgi:hypothetical protein